MINAQIGNENAGLAREIRKRLVDFYLDFDFIISGTLFQHKDILKLTWKYTDGKLFNDKFLIVWSIRLQLKKIYHRKSDLSQWIAEETYASVEERAKIKSNERAELTFLIQKMKGSLNESRRITTPRIRKLRRMPV